MGESLQSRHRGIRLDTVVIVLSLLKGLLLLGA